MTENTESARTPPTDGAPSLCFSFRAGLAFCLALVVLIYSNTLHSPLIFDDIPQIVDNPAIRLKQIDAAGLWRAAFESPHPNRPVANISFALNYRLHGLAVPGYHLVNILVHLLTGLFFYWLSMQTLARIELTGGSPPPGYGRESRMTALAAATLWMVHPLQTQSVTYTVQRMNSLAALFYLLTFLFYLRGRTVRQGWKKGAFFSATALSGLLAMGAKEIAIALPLFLFLYEWFFFRDLDRRWLRRQWPWLTALAAAGIVLAWIYLGDDPLARILASYDHRDFTPTERLLTEPRVIFLYLSLLAFPYPGRLNLDHQITVSRSLLSPPTTLPALILLTFLFFGVMLTARRHRLVSFAVLWYLGNLAMESSVFGLELVFEHRNYLPSMFLFLALVRGAERLFPDWRRRGALLGAAVLVLGIWTFQRNAVWRSDLTLWQDCAAKSPDKSRPHNKLGVALERRGRLAEAEVEFRRVIALDAAHPYAYFNLANVLARQGRLAEAVENYRKSLVLVPGNAEADINLGITLAALGKVDAALKRLTRVGPEKGAEYAAARKSMGRILLEAERFDAAVVQFEKALSADPANPALHISLGNAHFKAGRIEAAEAQYGIALKYAPDSAEAQNSLGIVRMQQGFRRRAISRFEKAVALAPENPAFRRNLAIARSREPTVAPPPGTLEKAQDKIGA